MSVTFAEVESAHGRWLYLDHDPDLLRIVCAVIIANRYDGPPVWLMIAGPSGGGKTAILTGVSAAAECDYTSAFTAAAFASGSLGTSPLLDELNQRVGLVKDFSTINSLPAEQRNNVLSILRDVYDGQYKKWTGRSTEPIEWQGKIGLIACSTPQPLERTVIDSQQLGERFMIIRLRLNAEAVKRISVAAYEGSDSDRMRDELEAISGEFLDTFQAPTVIPPDEVRDVIQSTARMIALTRSGVSRDRIDRAVDFPVMDSREIPARLVKQLKQLAKGLGALETPTDQIIRIIRRVGTDCMPTRRLRILNAIANGCTIQKSISDKIGLGLQPTRRVLESMKLLGVIKMNRRTGVEFAEDELALMFEDGVEL